MMYLNSSLKSQKEHENTSLRIRCKALKNWGELQKKVMVLWRFISDPYHITISHFIHWLKTLIKAALLQISFTNVYWLVWQYMIWEIIDYSVSDSGG